MTVVGKSVILRPSDILTSTDGDTETKVTFPEPIYLSPGREYAVVIISAHSDKYEMWIATMGEKTKKRRQSCTCCLWRRIYLGCHLGKMGL